MQVKWDEHKCCHAGVCVQELPEVFKVENGEFVINTEAASKEAIAEVCSQCPSGALKITE